MARIKRSWAHIPVEVVHDGHVAAARRQRWLRGRPTRLARPRPIGDAPRTAFPPLHLAANRRMSVAARGTRPPPPRSSGWRTVGCRAFEPASELVTGACHDRQIAATNARVRSTHRRAPPGRHDPLVSTRGSHLRLAVGSPGGTDRVRAFGRGGTRASPHRRCTSRGEVVQATTHAPVTTGAAATGRQGLGRRPWCPTVDMDRPTLAAQPPFGTTRPPRYGAKLKARVDTMTRRGRLVKRLLMISYTYHDGLSAQDRQQMVRRFAADGGTPGAIAHYERLDGRGGFVIQEELDDEDLQRDFEQTVAFAPSCVPRCTPSPPWRMPSRSSSGSTANAHDRHGDHIRGHSRPPPCGLPWIANRRCGSNRCARGAPVRPRRDSSSTPKTPLVGVADLGTVPATRVQLRTPTGSRGHGVARRGHHRRHPDQQKLDDVLRHRSTSMRSEHARRRAWRGALTDSAGWLRAATDAGRCQAGTVLGSGAACCGLRCPVVTHDSVACRRRTLPSFGWPSRRRSRGPLPTCWDGVSSRRAVGSPRSPLLSNPDWWSSSRPVWAPVWSCRRSSRSRHLRRRRENALGDGSGRRIETAAGDAVGPDVPRAPAPVTCDTAARERLEHVAAQASAEVQLDALVGVLVEADVAGFGA